MHNVRAYKMIFRARQHSYRAMQSAELAMIDSV